MAHLTFGSRVPACAVCQVSVTSDHIASLSLSYSSLVFVTEYYYFIW